MRSSNTLADIGERIQKYRRIRNISQEKFADLIGVHRNHVGRIERGETNIPVLTLQKIIKALHIKSTDVLPF